MKTRSIIIVGAGIGGLSAGCYGQMNGFQTRIFERHALPGGVCTGWERGGYRFDLCIHNLAGSSPHTALYRLWRDLGAVPARPMHAFDELVRIEGPNGKTFTVHADLDRLERHMKELSRADTRLIEELIEAARYLRRYEPLALPIAGPGELVRALPTAPFVYKWSRITVEQYAHRFIDPFLREAFARIIYDWRDTPMLLALGFLAGLHHGDLGWPLGGSLEFSRAIAQRYQDLGGELHHEAPVANILVEDDQAVGVRLADGSEHRADLVVSNADGRSTVMDMLDGRYLNARLRAYYTRPIERQDMALTAFFGVNREFPAEPHALLLLLDEPITVAGEPRERLSLELYGYDPAMAPPGKSVLKVVLNTSYAYWKALHQDPARYQAEKHQVADALLERLERRFPGLRGQVEEIDVTTPITLERYTGLWQGFQAWPPDERVSTLLGALMGRGWSRTLPGLKRFYMLGQWAGDGGLPVTAAAGRNLIRRLCWQQRRRFVTAPNQGTAG